MLNDDYKYIEKAERKWERDKEIAQRKIRIKSEKRLLKRSLGNSPINYFSDLFIVVMVSCWVVALPILAASAIYSMVINSDTSVWSYFTEIVTVPLSAGGALWMIKCGVQHAIANHKGDVCDADFPAIDGIEETIEKEIEME